MTTHPVAGSRSTVQAVTLAVAAVFLLGGGAVYLALWVYGLLIEMDSAANFVPLNTADNWLHLGLGLGMAVAGLLFRRRPQA